MIATLPFGRTGHQSTRMIFGGAALGKLTQAEADRSLEVLIDYGVNHLDVAASYGDAELRVAPWLKQDRSRFFLATKTAQRTYEDAKQEIRRSLDRLGVDRIDLIQLHNLADAIDWDIALSPGGALDACIEARDLGLVRFIGVTGHGTQIAATHARSLTRFDFDSVLLPCSFILMRDAHYAAQFAQVESICSERNVAIQTIKSVARRPWLGRERTWNTWYQPLSEQRDLDAAIHWIMARPNVFLSTPGDIGLLPKALDAAARYVAAPTDATMQEQIARNEMIPLFA